MSRLRVGPPPSSGSECVHTKEGYGRGEGTAGRLYLSLRTLRRSLNLIGPNWGTGLSIFSVSLWRRTEFFSLTVSAARFGYSEERKLALGLCVWTVHRDCLRNHGRRPVQLLPRDPPTRRDLLLHRPRCVRGPPVDEVRSTTHLSPSRLLFCSWDGVSGRPCSPYMVFFCVLTTDGVRARKTKYSYLRPSHKVSSDLLVVPSVPNLPIP